MTGDLSLRDLALLRAIASTPGHSIATFEAWVRDVPDGTGREFWERIFVFEATEYMDFSRWSLTEKGKAVCARAAEGKMVA